MNIPTKIMLRFALCSGLVALLGSIACSVAKATPYASALSNNGGTVSFILNEAADDVKIIFGGITNALGPRPAGLVTAPVGASNPFSIEVTKNSGPGYASTVANVSGGVSIAGKIQISSDPLLSRFPTPRGLAVNRNPASHYFGRIYVANSTPATIATRPVGRGLYSMNADFSDSPNGYGNTAQTGGLTFAGANANSPYRLSVGQDDYLYVSDFSDANGNLYRTDGNLQNGQWVFDIVGGPSPLPAGRNHGSTIKTIAEGSLEAGNLTVYTIDEDLGQSTTTAQNDVWRYDIGSGPLTNQATPTLISSAFIKGGLTPDFCKGGSNNYFYLVQNRAVAANPANAIPSLYVIDQNGTPIADTLTLSRELSGNPQGDNLLVGIHSVAISPNGSFLAANLITGSDTYIIPLTNGIPDLANVKILDTGVVAQGRSVDFDAAGNIYTASSGDGVVRAFSPGGFTIATTTSDGSFNVFVPANSVTVTAIDNIANETPGDTAQLSFVRTGDASEPLTVSYTLTGTAENGADYTLPGTVTFAAGESATNVTLTAINDASLEFVESVIVTLVGSASNNVGSPNTATIFIADNEAPELSITVVSPTMYERVAGDYARLRISRKGDTNEPVAANISYSGTAAALRYSAPTQVFLDSGALTTFDIIPIDNTDLDNDQTVVATIVSGSGYSVGATNSATVTILDDELPPEIVLFSDPLTGDTSSNWIRRFGANNLIEDYFVQFGWDVANDGFPPAPSGATTALMMTVNKNDVGNTLATTNGAAGINFYPNGQSFSGDYALRFNMLISQSIGGGTTEFAQFGINHSGTKTNWVRQSGTNVFNNPPRDIDGLWYMVSADAGGSAPGDFALLTGTNAASTATTLSSAAATTFTNAFKKPPYSAAGGGGSPANIPGTPTPTWADVEVKKIGNVVTMSINKTRVFQYTNATPFTTGNIMLGYSDPYESIGTGGGGIVYFSNVRVVNLSGTEVQPSITGIQLINGGTQVQIDFTGGSSDSFSLVSSGSVNGAYVPTVANITPLGSGAFRAVAPVEGAIRFYQIKRN